jgi:cyanophycinase-like exopeptidase
MTATTDPTSRSAPARILAIMGSGETAPTMKVPHRRIFDRLGPDTDAVLLDTPFGFQENAPILAAKAIEYFHDATGRAVDAAGLTRTDGADVVQVERAIARVRQADWVFAGPGSPSYALAQWQGTPIRDVLVDKLRTGGAVVFSSAAALTLGVATVPVYEIYKVGADPTWLEGLDVLREIGVDAAVIPHYDNQEGGNHDTRFCYLGERRLSVLEPLLPEGAYVLGIDEHTGLIIDLDADTAEVVGKGAVTMRRDGRSTRVESGTTVPIDVLRAGSGEVGAAPIPITTATDDTGPARDDEEHQHERESTPDSLAAETSAREAAFDAALEARDADAAVEAILRLESAIVDWSRDTLQSDEVDRARAALRSMIVRLGSAATGGLRDPRVVLGPVVEAALAARVIARSERAFAVADAIRDELTRAGIEVRDTPDGVQWLVENDTATRI